MTYVVHPEDSHAVCMFVYACMQKAWKCSWEKGESNQDFSSISHPRPDQSPVSINSYFYSLFIVDDRETCSNDKVFLFTNILLIKLWI